MRKITSLLTALSFLGGGLSVFAQYVPLKGMNYYISIRENAQKVYAGTIQGQPSDSETGYINHVTDIKQAGLFQVEPSASAGFFNIQLQYENNGQQSWGPLVWTEKVGSKTKTIRVANDVYNANADFKNNKDWVFNPKLKDGISGFAIAPEGLKTTHWNRHGSWLGFWGNYSQAQICTFIPADLDAAKAMANEAVLQINSGAFINTIKKDHQELASQIQLLADKIIKPEYVYNFEDAENLSLKYGEMLKYEGNGIQKTEIADVTPDFIYNLVTTRSALTINGNRLASAVKAGQLNISKDVRQCFMVKEVEGKKYLYSVGAGKYVNNNGSFSGTPQHEITLVNHDRTGKFFIKFGDNTLNIDGHNDAVIVNYKTPDDGNDFIITAVGVPVDVNYAYHFEGNDASVTTQSATQMLNSFYAAPALDLPYITVLGNTFGKVRLSQDPIDATIRETNLPFQKSENLENANWYFMSLSHYNRTSNGASDPSVLRAQDNAEDIFLNDGAYTLADNNEQWCFIGNTINGFKVYNRNLHKKLVTSTAMNGGGSQNPALCKEENYQPGNGETDTWFIAPSSHGYNTEANGFKNDSKGFFLGVQTNNGVKYVNKQKGKMVFWTGGADGGSTVYVNQIVPDAALAPVGEHTYTSLYLPFPAQVTSENVEVFYADLVGNTLTMHTIDDKVIPANTGVVLQGNTADVANAKMVLAAGNPEKKGNLEGTTVAMAKEAGNTYYVLNQFENQIGFFKFNGENLAANKAFVALTGAAGVNGFTLNFGDVTGVESAVEVAPQTEQVIYDLSGRRVAAPTKGLYIINGKKVYVK